MSELFVLVGRHVRTLLRSRAFLWSALLFAGMLALSVIAAPRATADFVPALWPAALVLVAWCASVGATGADALPADRIRGRTTWLRTLAPAGWKDRLGAALAAMGAVVVVGLVAALGLGIWAVLELDRFVLHAHSDVPLEEREIVSPSRQEGVPGAPWTLDLPPAGSARLVRRVQLRVWPYGRVRVGRLHLSYAAGQKQGEMDVATRGKFTVVVPAAARTLTLQSHTRNVGLRVREAAVLGEDRAPALPIGLRVIWISLLVAAVVPLGVACSRFTTSATAGGLVMCVLLLGMVRRPLLDLVSVLRTSNEPATAVKLLQAMGHALPDLPLLSLASDTADGRLVAFGSAAAWWGVLAFALMGLALVWLPLKRERLT